MKISNVTGTACEACKHFKVCKFSDEFIKAQKTVEDASISVTVDDDGETRHGSRPVSCIDYIFPIKHAEYEPKTQIRDYNPNHS